MTYQQTNWIGIQLQGSDRTFWALPRPEDEEQLAELLDRGALAMSLAGDDDVQAHAQSAEVTLDVEGHAMTLRMPTVADAASFRQGLALGVVTATIVVGGAAAALQGMAPTSIEQAPAAPNLTTDRVIHPQHQVEMLNPVAPAAPAAPFAPAAPIDRGSQRTINPVYNVDTVDVVAPAAPAAPFVSTERGIHPQHTVEMLNPAAPAAGASGASDPSAGDSSVPRAGQRPEPR